MAVLQVHVQYINIISDDRMHDYYVFTRAAVQIRDLDSALRVNTKSLPIWQWSEFKDGYGSMVKSPWREAIPPYSSPRTCKAVVSCTPVSVVPMNFSNKDASAYWISRRQGKGMEGLDSLSLAKTETASPSSISLSNLPLQHSFSTGSLTLRKESLSSTASTMTTESKSSGSDAKDTPDYGRELGLGMVDILIGPGKETFRVHKNLLCTKVPYFHKMFSGGFKEASEQAAKMPDDDPGTFGLFLEWLYAGRITPIPPIKPNGRDEHREIYFRRVKLYCFAEKIVCPKLMDYTMTVIISTHLRTNTLPRFEPITFVYQNSPSCSVLRKFMSLAVYRVVTKCSTEFWTNEDIREFLLRDEEGVMDLVKLLRHSSGKIAEDPSKMALCTFHVHPKTEECQFKIEKL
ncbi:Actin-binding protein [Lachnellula occidentalis]|uniref:Actin-binding protein n=1 Tax=Lachnellula occidentalis TaxID=215460 RepID=A0A8H8S6F7_9HELO|nr:Actin-binding protein [Lachnellula occidentalis]